MATEVANALGIYRRDRRTRLDPATFGFAGGRRRTPGLRREEVASRAVRVGKRGACSSLE